MKSQLMPDKILTTTQKTKDPCKNTKCSSNIKRATFSRQSTPGNDGRLKDKVKGRESIINISLSPSVTLHLIIHHTYMYHHLY